MGCQKPVESQLETIPPKHQEETETEAYDYQEELPSDYEGTLSMWGWDPEYAKHITEAFQKKYPNVTFEYTTVAHKDLVQKYETALITGRKLPDIGWAIVDSRGKVFDLDMWEALEQKPYCFSPSEVYDYLYPHLINKRGNVCGIEQSLSPAGLAYRKDLAKKYLGTDDPKELEAMMPDWESFIEKGKEVYEKSKGKVYMCFSLGDLRQFTQEQTEVAWSENRKIDVEWNFGRSIDLICRFRDEHIADDLIAWTQPWNQAFRGNEHIFTACATWSVGYSIEPNDPKGEQEGWWGLMSAPEGNANWGGTTMGITKTCKDKRLAWEFLRFATLSTEGAEVLNSIGLMTSAKQPYIEKPELKSFRSKWFGEQDLGVYFMDEIIPDIKTRRLTSEDIEIHESLGLLVNTLNTDRKITAEKALDLMRERLKKELPACTVY